MRKFFIHSFIFVLAGAAVFLIGCSLVGLGIGAAVDASQPDTRSFPGWEVTSVAPGSIIRVHLLNGDMLRGKYGGVKNLQQDSYNKAYEEKKQLLPAYYNLPDIGDTLVMTGRKEELSAQFFGLDRNSIRAQASGRNDTIRYPLYNIAQLVDLAGRAIVTDTLQNLINSAALPVVSALTLDTFDQVHQISLNEIRQVEIKTKKRAKLVGFVMGATVDALLIIAARTAAEETTSDTQDTMQFSCPFVYSFDGHEYVRDSEPFGGSLFEAAQRTDVDRLDYIREADGKYTLKMTNELSETQYVDAIKLLVVDCERGYGVYPTFQGQLVTTGNPVLPRSAVDTNQSDVLSLVLKNDDLFWTSYPGNNVARDGIVVEYAKPAHAAVAKLVISAQNTLWASYLQGQMLALQGDRLEAWYAHLNESAEARQALQQAMIREGMLLVKLFDGSSWRDAGFVWEVGPTLAKDVALVIDIKNVQGEKLLLKFESTTGFWKINSVFADYSPDIPVDVMVLSPQKAVGHQGENLVDVLSEIDGNRYVMPDTCCWARLEFSAPTIKTGKERSVFLSATGYYRINIEAKGQPDPDLISRLLTQPGAYGRVTVGMFNQYVADFFGRFEAN
jgi:hypothetical protein